MEFAAGVLVGVVVTVAAIVLFALFAAAKAMKH